MYNYIYNYIQLYTTICTTIYITIYTTIRTTNRVSVVICLFYIDYRFMNMIVLHYKILYEQKTNAN